MAVRAVFMLKVLLSFCGTDEGVLGIFQELGSLRDSITILQTAGHIFLPSRGLFFLVAV